MAWREARNFYIYIAPWLVGFIVLTLYPMLYSLYLSFTDMNLAGKGKIVGFENWVYAFTKDPLFFKAFGNTLKYVVMFVPSSIFLAFFISHYEIYQEKQNSYQVNQIASVSSGIR